MVDLVSLEADAVGVAGEEGEGLVEVLAELVGVPGAPRVVSGDLAAAGEGVSGVLEAGDVIALPGVEGERDGSEAVEGVWAVCRPRGWRRDAACQACGLSVVPGAGGRDAVCQTEKRTKQQSPSCMM